MESSGARGVQKVELLKKKLWHVEFKYFNFFNFFDDSIYECNCLLSLIIL